MLLHTLNATPTSNAFTDCLRLATGDDTILLLGDGVYAAIANSAACASLRQCPAQILVLEADATAAGLVNSISDFPLINMEGFVALSESHTRQLAWY